MSDQFLDLAVLDSIPDQTVLEEGEYELTIIKAVIGESGEHAKTAGQKYLNVTYKSTTEPDSKPFNDIFMIPFPGLETEQFNMRGRQLKAFFQCFGFDYTSGWNLYEETEDLVGLTGIALVKVRDDEKYGEQNEVKRYI